MKENFKKLQDRKFITLISDWGEKDYYAGAVKGRIYSLIPYVTVVDISHYINPFDITHAGYVLKNSFENFPEGTIHLIGVETEEFAIRDVIRSHLLVKFKGHYFIGADNGIFSIITDGEDVEQIVELTIPFAEINGKFKYLFSVRDRFAYVAAHIANGGKPDEIGNQIDEFKKIIQLKPTYTNELIKGVVIHVDNYENVIVNITEKLFYELLKDRKFKIIFRNYEIDKISKQYCDVGEQQISALFNSSGFLEIAMNKGNASSLIGLRINDTVIVEFFD